jgi:hypothetical protein
MRTRSQIYALLTELRAAQAAAPYWGAAVGARHEEIKALEAELRAVTPDSELPQPWRGVY